MRRAGEYSKIKLFFAVRIMLINRSLEFVAGLTDAFNFTIEADGNFRIDIFYQSINELLHAIFK